MSRVVRVAMTETCNAFTAMPSRVEDLSDLSDRLDAVRDANLAWHEELVAAAAADGARVVGLGELFPAPYFALGRDPLWRALAEDALTGPTTTRMRACARGHGVIVIAPLYEVTDEGRRFNTAVVIDATGAVLGRYRKTHLPEGANEQGGFAETFYYEPSDGDLRCGPANVSDNRWFPVFATDAGRIGVATCYDRHFEGVMSTLAGQGAEIVFSPAVTFGAQSERLWPVEFAADAARHRVWICGSNRRGTELPWNVEYFGRSLVVGPEGPVPLRRPHPDVVVADVDLDVLRQPPDSGWDLRRDRRPDIYG